MLRITGSGVNRVFNFSFGNGWRIDDAAVAVRDAGDVIQRGACIPAEGIFHDAGDVMFLMLYFISN